VSGQFQSLALADTVVTYIVDVALSVSDVSSVQTMLCGVGIGCGKIAL
jgi:hypothetical protein